MVQHEQWMSEAAGEALLGLGRTSPNPPVGAVVVRDGRIVGRGHHARAGGPHAEVVALRDAGEAARGATLYVTLEPCNHDGRTPPCTEAIIAAGVAEVRYGVADPNPRVAGGGHARLAEAGLRVACGPGERQAAQAARFWLHRVTTGRPYVVAKFAASLDGRIAGHTGASRWITGPEARRAAHGLRAEVDAVLVGADTAIADDPLLTVRLPGHDGPQPLRVVLDSSGRVPLDRQLFRIDGARTVVVTTDRMPADRQRALEDLGVRVLRVAGADDGRVAVPAALDALAALDVVSILVEGGAAVTGSFYDAGCIDEGAAFIAPLLLGGAGSPAAIGGRGAAGPADALRIDDPTMTRVGDDWLIRGRIRTPFPEEA